MSNNQMFENIMNEFNSDGEDEDEEGQYEENGNRIEKRQSASNLSENMNNKIKDILPDIRNEKEENIKNIRTKRDQFGYFINDDNEVDSEESNSNNNNEQEQEQCSYSSNNNSSEKQKNESQNDEDDDNIRNNNEEEENNEKEKINYSDEVEEGRKDEEEKEENNKKNNNNILQNSTNKEEKEENNNENNNENNEEKNSNGQNFNENDEQNDLINELYVSNNKHENTDSNDGEAFRMNSFRPNPIPGSPKFTNTNQIDNDNINNSDTNNNINNNIMNFTETIETKIEGDASNKNTVKEEINKNEINSILTHNKNIISLGKINPSDSVKVHQLDLYNNNSIDDNNNNNNIRSIEDEEEAFLEREEMKRRKSKERKKKENKIEEEGKENVTEDEEDSQTQILNNIKIQKNNDISNSNEEVKEEINIKKNKNKEKLKEEVTEDEEENNNIINKKDDLIKKNSVNEINNNQVKVMSIKLVEQYDKVGDSRRQSETGTKNKSKNNNILSERKYQVEKKNINNKLNTNSKKQAMIPNNKKYKLNSPLNKNDKSNVKQNYYSENKQIISGKKFMNKNNLQSIKKDLGFSKNDVKPKLYEQKSPKKIDNSKEKYPFLPNINPKSRKICEKKENRANAQIGDILYEDAKNKKEKLKQIYINENNNILSNMNSKKINKSSYSLVIDRINKKIDNVIKKYSVNGKISIVGMTQCLFELNLITELIKIKDNIQDINDDLDSVELQSIIESIKNKDTKKLKEVEFLEQLWFIINPSKTQYINCKILSDFLKLLFSSKNNVKDLENNIEKLFEKYNINKSSDNEIKEEEESFTSPLRDKEYKTDEIWPLDKFIKIFIDLKNNLKAYKENNYQKGEVYNNIIQERDKELTFEPNFSSKAFFYKHSKYNYDKDNDIDNNNISNISNNKSPKRQKHDFNKVYERFMADKDLHDKTLERLRKIKVDKELKMCTDVPKINKYVPSASNKKYKNKTMDSDEPKTLQKNKSYSDIKNPIYMKLYKQRKEYNENNNINNNDNSTLDENCTFKPVITDPDVMMKTFSNMKNMRKPKGYNEYVKRNRSVLEKKENDKKIEEDKKFGRNYDKIKKLKIKALNITDLNGSNKKSKKINIPIPSSNSNRSYQQKINLNNDFMNNSESEKVENIIDGVYITIDIKVPNGLLKPLKIYNKGDNETIELVNNFCRIYTINEENKKIILKNVLQYKNAFFGRNLINDNKKEGFVLNEDLDTITNTYSNNSNH